MFSVFSVDVDWGKAGCSAPEAPAELRVYILPHTESISMVKDRPMVIVVPGGAYQYCSDREAEPIALRFLAMGMHAAILRYSCAPARYPVAALELARSVQLCREHAEEWHIRTDAIAVCGFSAGGHLAGTVGTLWKDPVFARTLGPGDGRAWRPDLQVLCYAVLTMGSHTHEGSRYNLLGEEKEKGNQLFRTEELSLETRVDQDTPPAFLWHTGEDGSVPVENSLMYAAACRRNGVPFELHVFETGGHGLSACDWQTAQGTEQLVPDNTSWMELAGRFIMRHAGL